jgi:aryl-alcohol dehydrogenase-like predicted oxidoreductase
MVVMRYRSLGESGLQVSVVGLGCNNFGSRLDVDGTRAVVDAAIDAGITLFDTSDTYGPGGGSERALGEVLAGRRDQVVLATKFGNQNNDMGYGPAAGAKGGRAYIRRAVTESLRRLRTDHIDLYQLHTPDPVTPVEETIAALHELVAEGKVRYLGHSNFSGWQLADAAHLAAHNSRTPFVSAQNHWSLLERNAEADVVPAARHFGLGVFPARQRPADRQGQARSGDTGRDQAGRPRKLRHRGKAGQGRSADHLGAGARRHDLGRGDRCSRGAAGMFLGDRGRDDLRTGQGQCGHGRVDPVR